MCRLMTQRTLCLQQLMSTLGKLAENSAELRSHDCFTLFLMGHGKEGTATAVPNR